MDHNRRGPVMLSRSMVLILLLMAACSSPKNNKMPHYAHLKQLIPPDSQKYTPSRVYVDSVKMISRNDKKRLLISGNLADGCTRLQKANHALQHDSLTISLTAWKPADKICTQALVPFSFIYDKLPPATLKTITTVRVNQNYFEIK